MKKQLLLLLITLPFIFSCNAKKDEDTGKNSEPSSPVTEDALGSTLVGKWSICSEGAQDGSVVQYNVCPEVTFTSTAVATISFNNIDRETLQWKTNNDTVFLAHSAFTTIDTVRLFPDNFYVVNKSVDSVSLILKFVPPGKNYFINLSRPKN